ncbi:MAG: CRTAC1 family protein [Planctomycetes bacterium]|nr:CRTAC1 family protein [Planctomycetota bacterium]
MSPTPLVRAATNLGFVLLLGYTAWQGHRGEAVLDSQLGFHLRECAQEHGIDFHHQNAVLDPKLDNIAVQIAGLGAAVSVVDADGDGWADLYTTTSLFGAKNALYINQHDGTFRDRGSEAGLADVNLPGEGASMGSIWADYDNDGRPDCFLYKYGYAQLFHNDGNLHFSDVTQAAGLRRWTNTNGACWIDYDRDGLLDLYVTGYFREDVDLWNLKTTRIMQDSFEFATNGGHRHFYRNLGGGRFEEVTDKLGVDSTRWALAVAAADMNGDGWPDLYVANDYGTEELFLNQKGERFERAQNIGLDESSKSGMSVALGDIQNDGTLGAFVTNISKRGYLFQGNNLRLNLLARGLGLNNVSEGQVLDCGWAWGSQFGDVDNDGRQDLVVLNGFVSGNQKRDEYWYDMTKLAAASGELAEDAASWPDQGDRGLSGYEPSRLLLNESTTSGKKRVTKFTDVALQAGMDDLLDGRAVSMADFFHKGKLDLVVANQQGPLLFYENTVDPKRHWIQFELEGTRSNREAIGAQLTLSFGGVRTAQAVLAGSGFCSQNDLVLHYGLGANDAVEKAVIRWPSGAEQTIEAPAIDQRHHVKEP